MSSTNTPGLTRINKHKNSDCKCWSCLHLSGFFFLLLLGLFFFFFDFSVALKVNTFYSHKCSNLETNSHILDLLQVLNKWNLPLNSLAWLNCKTLLPLQKRFCEGPTAEQNLIFNSQFNNQPPQDICNISIWLFYIMSLKYQKLTISLLI